MNTDISDNVVLNTVKKNAISTIDYCAHSGIDELGDEAGLLALPEIQVLVGFYKYSLKQLTEDKSRNGFTTKLKLKLLSSEYAVLTRAVKDTNIRLQKLDADNVQAKADLAVFSQRLADICQYLMLRHNITNPRFA